MLPKLELPEFTAVVPSTKQTVTYRPFTVKEEKILFMALEGEDAEDIARAMTTIVDTCVTTPTFDISKLAHFDIEYLFLQLRSKSIGNIIQLRLRHSGRVSDCNHVNSYELNVDDIKVEFKDGHTNKVMITDDIGFVMKYPKLYSNIDVLKILVGDDVDKTFDFIADHIEYVFDQEKVYEDTSKEEVKAFVEKLNRAQFEKVVNFFSTIPSLSHTITYKCEECGKEDVAKIEGFQNFFI